MDVFGSFARIFFKYTLFYDLKVTVTIYESEKRALTHTSAQAQIDDQCEK